MTLRQKWILAIIFFLLTIPLVAMLFTNEVSWTLIDFVAATIILGLSGFLLDFILRKAKNKKRKVAYVALLILALILCWGELAVGIFGSPFAGN